MSIPPLHSGITTRYHDGMVGERLRELRQKAGLSARGLGRLAGIPGPTVSRIEAGREKPRVPTLMRLTRALSGKLGLPEAAVLWMLLQDEDPSAEAEGGGERGP